MRKTLAALAVVALATFAVTGTGHAVDMAKGDCGLGFFDQNAPIGGIYWFSPKAALAAGIGFQKPDEGDTEFDFTVGIPINVIETDRANFQVRPRFFFGSNGAGPGADFLAVGGDLVAEVFVAPHFSLLAGHGLEFTRVSASGNSTTRINTRAISGSSVGFFYYLQH